MPSSRSEVDADALRAAVPHPCPRCGQDRGIETRLLCPACWQEAPAKARQRFTKALRFFQSRHPAARALLTWARPAGAEAPAGPVAGS